MTKSELLERVNALPEDWCSVREDWDEESYEEEVPALPPIHGPRTRLEHYAAEATLQIMQSRFAERKAFWDWIDNPETKFGSTINWTKNG